LALRCPSRRQLKAGLVAERSLDCSVVDSFRRCCQDLRLTFTRRMLRLASKRVNCGFDVGRRDNSSPFPSRLSRSNRACAASPGLKSPVGGFWGFGLRRRASLAFLAVSGRLRESDVVPGRVHPLPVLFLSTPHKSHAPGRRFDRACATPETLKRYQIASHTL
jgi:hypothetical protein